MGRKRIIIGGQEIELELLGQEIDQMFIKLHTAYFGTQSIDMEEFEAAALKFFDENPKPSMLHNYYFHNFTIIWNSFLYSHKYGEAEHIWDLALSPALKWEVKNPNERIHKGSAFYFWGKTALEHGDIDKGYALMHQSVEEDILTSGIQSPDTPAYAFATLNYDKTDQGFRVWVLNQADFINGQLIEYAKRNSRNFELDDFRKKYLLNPPSVDISFIFTFALARLIRLYNFPSYIIKSRFVAQLQANILFDLVLVIDAVIKPKNKSGGTFINQAEFLLSRIGEPLTNPELREINTEFIDGFEKTLISVLDRTLTLKNGKPLTQIQADLAVVYGLRNHEAHEISSVSTIWKRYKEILQSVMNTLFASVDFLY